MTVGGSTLSQTVYDSAGRVSRQTYGNGKYIDFTYDNLDRITSKVYNNSSNDKVVYYYGTNGKLSHTVDFAANTHTKYIYDLAGRIVEQKVYSGTDLLGINLLSSVKYKYAEKTGKTESITYGTAVGSQDYIYTYGSMAAGTNPDAVYGVTYNGNRHIEYSYDGLGRITERKLNVPNQSYTYAYKAGGHGANSTTTLVESVTSGDITFGYTYDQNGNITEIKRNGVTVESYTYDSLNQLKTVTRNGVTTEYTYSNGNITNVKQNGETVKSYTYGDSTWRDLLTEYNGQTITYDQIGNPLTYRGKNMTWQNGRRLAGITDANNTIAYAYDADGNRISKTVNGVTTDYVVIDGTLAGEIKGGNKLAFLYDESGTKYGFVYNGATYFYNLNLQGDVVGIYDSTGAEVVNYTYDEWGKILSATGTLASTIGQINPIRYRGYYYDNETGFYFLQSRYYDPETGRFLNADGYVSTGQGILGNNMFAYCGNNPVNYYDPNGECYYNSKGQWCHDNWEYIGNYKIKQDPGVFVTVNNTPHISLRYQLALTTQDNIKKTNTGSISNNTSSSQVNKSIVVAQNITALTIQPYTFAMGCVAGSSTTAFEAATISGVGYFIVTPINIAIDWANPQLTNGQKWAMTGYEVTTAAIGVMGTYAIANYWNPSGWVMGMITLGYSATTYLVGSAITANFEKRNGY